MSERRWLHVATHHYVVPVPRSTAWGEVFTAPGSFNPTLVVALYAMP